MSFSKPISLVVISILNFVIGGIGLIWTLSGITTMASQPVFHGSERTMGMVLMVTANNFLSIGTFALSIISGIALLAAKKWARGTSFAFVFTFVVNIFFSMYLVMLVSNANSRIENPGMSFGLFIGLVLYMIYPTVVFFYLRSRAWLDYLSIENRTAA